MAMAATIILLTGQCGLARIASSDSESPPQRRRFQRSSNRVYKASISPHWFADNTHFWYRNDLSEGRREFIVVDAVKGVRKTAFDHKRLADALKKAGLADIAADRLPLEDLDFRFADNVLLFRIGDDVWSCHLETYAVGKLKDQESDAADRLRALPVAEVPPASTRTGPDTSIVFVNCTSGQVELFWVDTGGRRNSYGKISPGNEHEQHTYAGHVWEVVDGKGDVIAAFQANDTSARAEITGRSIIDRRRSGQGERSRASRDESPDGKWTALIRDNNVYIRSKDGGGEEIQLSQDGSIPESYGMLQWAPDSKTLVGYRIEAGERKEVYLVQSSPPGGGRAVLRSRPYSLPGDKFTSYELNIFNVVDKTQLKPKVDRIDFGRPRLRWNPDGHRFTYEKTDRGHQRFRIIEVDSHTGDTRNIIDEKTDTFIWTAHAENIRMNRVNWITDTNEIDNSNAMIAITTSNSISVNAFLILRAPSTICLHCSVDKANIIETSYSVY